MIRVFEAVDLDRPTGTLDEAASPWAQAEDPLKELGPPGADQPGKAQDLAPVELKAAVVREPGNRHIANG